MVQTQGGVEDIFDKKIIICEPNPHRFYFEYLPTTLFLLQNKNMLPKIRGNF